MPDSVLLIDDDADVLRAVGDYFDKIGFEVGRADAAEAGFEAFDRMRPDVVILDLHLPDIGGLEVLERLRSLGGSVILLTGQGDIATAVRAMQLGAEHFLTKPVDLGHLAAATARVCDKIHLARENALLRARGRELEGLESLGVSPAIRELGRQVELLSASERSTVLLTGESGTGKGWVARVIHHLSPRASGPFVEVNCGGLSATFLESELFGHEKGAFTDAKERRQGLFELADRGTIFLDEIGDLAPELQPKLRNVREMRNVVERAMILARGAGQIGLEHLPSDLRRSGGSGGGDRRHQPQALAEVERVHIEKTLKFHGGNRTRAALELGISRATLINKIKVYGLDV